MEGRVDCVSPIAMEMVKRPVDTTTPAGISENHVAAMRKVVRLSAQSIANPAPPGPTWTAENESGVCCIAECGSHPPTLHARLGGRPVCRGPYALCFSIHGLYRRYQQNLEPDGSGGRGATRSLPNLVLLAQYRRHSFIVYILYTLLSQLLVLVYSLASS